MSASSGRLEAADLAAVPMLASVASARLSRLAASCQPRRWPMGQVLFARGDPATRLLIVLHGRVSALVDHRDGTRSRYPLMYAPCVIDKASVLAGEPHRATWTAVSPGGGAVVSAEMFRTLLAAEPGLRDHVLRYLAGQVSQGRAALADHATARSVTLVARWLAAA
ncbi:MAG: Crp/Fnr family transcriptional regulator, partial [Streptosporangiaceae bacterium]